MTKNKIDIAIVGGGLMGMMSAYFLAESGFKIALFDQSKLAGESSWAGGGILTPLYPWRYADSINKLAFRSQMLYPSLISELRELSGTDPQYYKSGMLVSEMDIDQNARHWFDRHNIKNQIAQHEHLQNVSVDDNYLYFPEIAQVRNPRLAQSLALALGSKSIALHDYCAVDQIEQDERGRFKLNTTKGLFNADRVLVCAGAWSGKILAQLACSIAVKPVRGQMLLFKAEENLLPSIVLAEGKYIIPRLDGHVLVGSTMEDVGFDKTTTQQAFKDLMEFVQRRSPELAKFQVVKHWSGLRPGSPEGVPFIFEHPEQKGLFVNTGHFRNGVVLAPASAEIIRDLLLNIQPVVDIQSFSYYRTSSQENVANNTTFLMD